MSSNILTVKLEKDDEAIKELIALLSGEGELPFELPRYLPWPRSSKEVSKRAQIVLLAGLEYLKAKHPLASASERQGAYASAKAVTSPEASPCQNQKPSLEGWS